MAHNYVVTAQHPTSVTVCDTVRYVSSSKSLELDQIRCKPDNLCGFLSGQLHGSRGFESDNWKKYKN